MAGARVPLPAAALGVAGLLPFAAGALAAWGLMPGISNPFTGLLVLQTYGAAILAFMGGCLWGFAAQAARAGWLALGLSAIPALWAFGANFAADAIEALIAGFVVLMLLDAVSVARGLGPAWWLRLRLPLTAVVLICLIAGALA
ncbi:DUF3429 family protein [Rhodobacteraceae bacterium 2CG4]|uniref:DUF3429 family protein n=1 Tax=Halovulum marinum TaxID=2662447 RepID=A0A6L5YV56_9RHOB|nr:DUF3429 domain-containing protein [Halovulum marinum]MSU88158.1 DUF3429 family protein [Halovulum marinum]